MPACPSENGGRPRPKAAAEGGWAAALAGLRALAAGPAQGRTAPRPGAGPSTTGSRPDPLLPGSDNGRSVNRERPHPTRSPAASPTPAPTREAADYADHVTSDQFKAGFANLEGDRLELAAAARATLWPVAARSADRDRPRRTVRSPGRASGRSVTRAREHAAAACDEVPTPPRTRGRSTAGLRRGRPRVPLVSHPRRARPPQGNAGVRARARRRTSRTLQASTPGPVPGAPSFQYASSAARSTLSSSRLRPSSAAAQRR